MSSFWDNKIEPIGLDPFGKFKHSRLPSSLIILPLLEPLIDSSTEFNEKGYVPSVFYFFLESVNKPLLKLFVAIIKRMLCQELLMFQNNYSIYLS